MIKTLSLILIWFWTHLLKYVGCDCFKFLVLVAIEVIGADLPLYVILNLGFSSSSSSFLTLFSSLIAPFYSPGKTSNAPVIDAAFLLVLVPYGLNGGSPSWQFEIFGGAGGFLGGYTRSHSPITSLALLKVPK